MSSIRWTLADQQVLPTGLIDLAKAHLRVDGGYEDALIRDKIAAAISWFERVTNVSVNPVTWVWKPDSGDFVCGKARVPVSPVQEFAVSAGGTDVTGNFELVTMSMHGVGLFYLAGTFASGMIVTLESGYPDAMAVEAGIRDAVMRYAAHLYENREILVPGVEAVLSPDWETSVISTYWMPRA